ncbi:MAG TPA: peptidyl-prolyl cis-trans isomerase, partial [Polyangiaceae bacterium]
TIERIVDRTGITGPQAGERAIRDALFAARATEQLAPSLSTTLERAAAGRALLEGMLEEARARGAPTDAEIEAATRERWVEFDRPPGARVTHAVVLTPEAPGETAKAERVANALVEALRGIADPAEFIARAKSVPAEGLTVRTEQLPAMTPAGRAFTLDGGPVRGAPYYDRTFAEAANALSSAGAQSGIVRTRFGFHVILLEEKIPELRVPAEDRRRLLTDDVLSRRAGEMRRTLMESLSASVRVEIARDFEARTAGLGGS